MPKANPLASLVQEAEDAEGEDSDDSLEAQREEAGVKNQVKNPIVFVRVTSAELTLLLDSIGDQYLYDNVMAKPDSVTTIVQSYLAQKAEVDKVLQQELEKEKSQK